VDKIDFEGSLVLEKMARVDKMEEFMDAVDDNDLTRAKALMREAAIDAETIKIVLKKMASEDDEH